VHLIIGPVGVSLSLLDIRFVRKETS
jgi:hypothetical protein